MSKPPVKPDAPKRRYHSPKRSQAALQTRRRIRSAARSLFLAAGYSSTSMSSIATAAGVAQATVFLVFPSKAALLSEIIQVAVRGDDQDLAVAARPDWQALLALSADQLIVRFAQGTTILLGRTARVLALGESAADQDPELAALRDRGHARMRSDFQQIAQALTAQGALNNRRRTQDAADTIYALANHAVYLRLTDDCGWSPERYTNWLAHTLTTTLIRPASPAA
jgi:AcrR family transcriptional regulator